MSPLHDGRRTVHFFIPSPYKQARAHSLRSQRAFTLVELSIVLVILGLLVGGVLAGQSLIKAAELRAVSTEYTNFHTALGTFRDKYLAMPGDMPNAVRYWGRAGGTDADGAQSACYNVTTEATGTETCNGNGDGIIGGRNYATAADSYELHRAWQHLANAGMVEGKYTGVRISGGAASNQLAGTNAPRSKWKNAGWLLFTPFGDLTWAGAWFPISYSVSLGVGLPYGGGITIGPSFKPEEAYNIDMKMDDGKPATGRIVSHPTSNPIFANCNSAGDVAYNLSYPSEACSPIFLTGY